MSIKTYSQTEADNALLVYVQSERTYLTDSVEVEVVRGSGNDVRIDVVEKVVEP